MCCAKYVKKGKPQKFITNYLKRKLINAFTEGLSTTNETSKKSATNATTTNPSPNGQKKSSVKPSKLNLVPRQVCCDECPNLMEDDVFDTPACAMFLLYIPEDAVCYQVNDIRQDLIEHKGEELEIVVLVDSNAWSNN